MHALEKNCHSQLSEIELLQNHCVQVELESVHFLVVVVLVQDAHQLGKILQMSVPSDCCIVWRVVQPFLFLCHEQRVEMEKAGHWRRCRSCEERAAFIFSRVEEYLKVSLKD